MQTEMLKPVFLTLALLNKLRCHIHFQFTANQIRWSGFLIEIHIFNDKQCRFRSVPHELSDDTPHSWCGGGNIFGGQDVHAEKHWQISHGLAGAQQVGVGGTNQLTLTVSLKDPWLDDPKKSRGGRRRKKSMLAAGVTRKRRRCLYQIKGWWFFFVSFYFSPGVVAQLSKCEITLCIGNTHVLKLFSFDQIFNSETYRPWPLCIWSDQAR